MADETYHADRLSHPPVPSPALAFGTLHQVTSAPDASLGADGDGAVNTVTGAFYTRANGVWSLASGATELFSGNYSGTTPNFTPSVANAIATDTSDGSQNYWFAGAWH